MKKSILLAAIILTVCFTDVSAQTKFMHLTTIESVVGGGVGRSRMIITDENGNQKEKGLDNLFSMVGINISNIKRNENDILDEISKISSEGWTLISTIPMTLSPGQNGAGIFMTRYLFAKD